MAENSTQVASTIQNTCSRLSIGETTFHKLVKEGRLRVFKVGKKTLVPEAEIERFVAEQLAAHAQARSPAAS